MIVRGGGFAPAEQVGGRKRAAASRLRHRGRWETADRVWGNSGPKIYRPSPSASPCRARSTRCQASRVARRACSHVSGESPRFALASLAVEGRDCVCVFMGCAGLRCGYCGFRCRSASHWSDAGDPTPLSTRRASRMLRKLKNRRINGLQLTGPVPGVLWAWLRAGHSACWRTPWVARCMAPGRRLAVGATRPVDP